MATQTSAMPGAIDALIAALEGDAELSNVDVVDGPLLDWEAMTPAKPQRGDGSRWLVVGGQPGDESRAAEGGQEWGATGTGMGHSRDERFAIYCTAVVFDGGQDVKAARDAAFAVIARVEDLLRVDPTIDGAVLYAEFGGVTELRQTMSSKGTTVDALFYVAARAYLEA